MSGRVELGFNRHIPLEAGDVERLLQGVRQVQIAEGLDLLLGEERIGFAAALAHAAGLQAGRGRQQKLQQAPRGIRHVRDDVRKLAVQHRHRPHVIVMRMRNKRMVYKAIVGAMHKVKAGERVGPVGARIHPRIQQDPSALQV